jgi:hypothetical protein
MVSWFGRDGWYHLVLDGRSIIGFVRPEKIFDTVEDLLAGAAAYQAGAQLQLVMRNPECRMAMRTLGCERHGGLY